MLRFLAAVLILGTTCHCQNRGSKRYTPSPFLQREDLHFRPEFNTVEPISDVGNFRAQHQANQKQNTIFGGQGFSSNNKSPLQRVNRVSNTATTVPAAQSIIQSNNFAFNVHAKPQPNEQGQPASLKPVPFKQPASRRRVTVQRRRKTNSRVSPEPLKTNQTARKKDIRKKATKSRSQTAFLFTETSGNTQIIPQVAIRPHSQTGSNRPSVRAHSPEEQNTNGAPLSVVASRADHASINGESQRQGGFNSGLSNIKTAATQSDKLPLANEKQRVISIPNLNSNQQVLAARRVRFRGNAGAKPTTQDEQQQHQSHQTTTTTTTTSHPSIKLQTVNSFLQASPGFVTTGRPSQPDFNRQWVSSIPSIGSIPLAPVSQDQTTKEPSNVLPQQLVSNESQIKSSRHTDFNNARQKIFEPGTFSFSTSTFTQDSTRPRSDNIKQERISQAPQSSPIPIRDFHKQSTNLNTQNPNVHTIPVPSHNFKTVHTNTNSKTRVGQRRKVTEFKESQVDDFFVGSRKTNEPKRIAPKSPTQSQVRFQQTNNVNSNQGQLHNIQSSQIAQNQFFDDSKESGSTLVSKQSDLLGHNIISTPHFTTRQPSATNSIPFTTGSFHIVDGQLKTAPFLDLAKDSSVISHQFPRFSEVRESSPPQRKSSDPNRDFKQSPSFSPSPAVRNSDQQPRNRLQSFPNTPDVSVRTTPSERSQVSEQRKIIQPVNIKPNRKHSQLNIAPAAASNRNRNTFAPNSAIDNKPNTPFREGRFFGRQNRPVAQLANLQKTEVRPTNKVTHIASDRVEKNDNINLRLIADGLDDVSLQSPGHVSFPSFHQALADNKQTENQQSAFNVLGSRKDSSGFHEEVIFSHPSSATEVLPGFTCEGKPYGYYADTINACRVFHICQPVEISNDTSYYSRYSFTCGRETIFDQSKLSCIHEREAMPCKDSSQWLHKNGEFGELAL